MFYWTFLMFLHSIINAEFRINMYYTDDSNDINHFIQNNCLFLFYRSNGEMDKFEKLSFCFDDISSMFRIQISNKISKYTFKELDEQNITCEHLYYWSASIDIIEQYQLYLNTNDTNLARRIFYNCTLPRFGPQCQYEFTVYDETSSSLYANIQKTLRDRHDGIPSAVTCYEYLECDRGNSFLCLDWTEICNDRIDCLNDGVDEKDCWQLEINQCNENEYRCLNGECVSILTDKEETLFYNCFDRKNLPDTPSNPESKCSGLGQNHYDLIDDCDNIKCLYFPLSSACSLNRQEYLLRAMYINDNNFLSNHSWLSLTCFTHFSTSDYPICRTFCYEYDCIEIINKTYPEQIFYPNQPVLFGNIYFVYMKSELLHSDHSHIMMPPYICYTTNDYDDYFHQHSKLRFMNFTCIDSKNMILFHNFTYPSAKFLHETILNQIHLALQKYHLPWNYTSELCQRPQMYQCIHSLKCISIYRLLDGTNDCPNNDDENEILISSSTVIQDFMKHFLMRRREEAIHVYQIRDIEQKYYLRNTILFQHICDRFGELLPININGINHTDETECEQWECDNMYTHCNLEWNCLNGQDETGCTHNNGANCSRNFHSCVLRETNQLICLSKEKINDGFIDCLGATDENILNEQRMILNNNAYYLLHFYCQNKNASLFLHKDALCNDIWDCQNGDDEQFCTTQRVPPNESVCFLKNYHVASNVEKFLCDYPIVNRNWDLIHFRLGNHFFQEQITLSNSIGDTKFQNPYFVYCHQGIDVRLWLNETANSFILACICPPYYYGSQCQYQHQRIALLVHVQSLSDSIRTAFTIFILLIDNTDERIIQSYDYLTYSSVAHCLKTFRLILLYGNRPKNLTKHYKIHIDLYETLLLKYRGSLLFPIQFPFLPVHRLAIFIPLPPNKVSNQNCYDKKCQHGQCIRYWNNTNDQTFCQCERGWTGKYCSIPYNCHCSTEAKCLGRLGNKRSICVCPKNTFGTHCSINTTTWSIQKKSPCQNGGELIFTQDYLNSNESIICYCQKGFNGEFCQIIDSKLIFTFDENVKLSQKILIHFINIKFHDRFQYPFNTISRSLTFQIIDNQQDSLVIYWSYLFHLVFIEFLANKHYYLAVIDNSDNQTKLINKTIESSDRCHSISELFNQTFLQWHLIRRIKYYHLPCQNRSLNLKCFHDESHFCLCYDYYDKRLANCFLFDHNLTYDCSSRSECEHGGQCLQDDPACPTRTMCLCQSCYYGRLCQFNTNGFGYSLDALLGDYIRPNRSLSLQPFIIKISLALTVLIFSLGLINGILSFLTFKNKSVREVGCGLYLLTTSINSIFLMIFFALKFLFLLLTQMKIITNSQFFRIQCYSIDFLLRICLQMDQWLYGCVAFERVITTIQGARFDKKRSKKIAKLVLIVLCCITIGSSIHDPISRHVLGEGNVNNDEQSERTWCIVRYRPGLRIYDYFINTIHFFGPFLINIVSSIVLIIKKAHQELKFHQNQAYRDLFRVQFQLHRHILVAPIVLIILAIPRLILIYVPKCIESNNDNATWLFLVGYFISFIPSMMTFLVFVMPSKFYKKELGKTLDQYRNILRQHV